MHFLQLLSLLSTASVLRLLVPGALVLFRASLTAEEIISLMFPIVRGRNKKHRHRSNLLKFGGHIESS